MKFSVNRKVIITLLSTDKRRYQRNSQIWDKYETELYNCIKCNGKVETLRRYKECYAWLRNTNLELPTQPIPFCRVDKRGIPKPLWSLRPLLKEGKVSLRLALSIARTYEIIKLPIDYSTDSITSDPLYKVPLCDIDQHFKIFLEKFTHKYPWYLGTLQKQSPIDNQVFTTLSKGPNGPAVAFAHLDAKGVIQDGKLFKHIMDLNRVLGQEWITQWMIEQANSFRTEIEYNTGRLGFSSEPAGKTRIFAIADYWSQCALKVIQVSLYDTLKSISTDSTRNQDKGFKTLIQESLGRRTYCFDLSSASDRIPASMQVHRLNLLKEGLGQHWLSVMTDRDFVIKGHNKKVRWKVGQPLGLLSSFPSFALWHHDIIQFAYNIDRIEDGKPLKFFKDYRLLGDDVVIFNDKVAGIYQDLMDLLDIPINLNKSVLGNEHHSQIEFTKRLALDGMEMSSIKNNILNKNSITSIIDLIDILYEREFISRDTERYDEFKFLSPKETGRLNFFLWARSDCKAPYVCKDNPTLSISRESFDIKVKEERSSKLRSKAMMLDQHLCRQKSVETYFKRHSVPYNAKALGLEALNESRKLHPIVWALNQIGLELSMVLSVLWDDESLELSPVEYMPLISTESFFRRSNAKTEYISEIISGIYKDLTKSL